MYFIEVMDKEGRAIYPNLELKRPYIMVEMERQ
jgi:hypothetical protein